MSDVDNIHRLAGFKRERAKANGTGTNGEDKRPVVTLEADNLEEVVDKSEAALMASGRGLYQRGGKIVAIGTVRTITARGEEIAAQRIQERGDHALFEDLISAATFEKYDGRSHAMKPVEPPMKLVKVLKERTGRLRFPPLTGIINAPTLRGDGSILEKPGYDEATGLLYDPAGTVFEKVPDKPSRAEAERALAKLNGLICTFPFEKKESKSVLLSAMITGVIRRSLTTAPAHGLSARVAETGKSKAVDLVSIFATGREAGVLAQGRNEEETEKRLAAVLMAGDPVIAIDNIEEPLGGDLLCQMLTQTTVRCRILGRSEILELPTGALITATGNNLTFVGDMTRRALRCTLDPQVERPEKRKFDNDPIADAKSDRGAYVSAILTILRGYVAAGRPWQVDPLGSFVEWSDMVRSALIWLGEADPVDTMEEIRARDPRLVALQAILSQWWMALQDETVSVRDVIAKATEKTRPNQFNPEDSTPGAFVRPEFREALLTVAGRDGVISNQRLGTWLGKNEKTISTIMIADAGDTTERPVRLFLFRGNPVHNTQMWSLCEATTITDAAGGSRCPQTEF